MDEEQFAVENFNYRMKNCLRINPSFEGRLWTESEVKSLPGFNNRIYSSLINKEDKWDYLKIILLLSEGGVFIENTYACLKDQKFLHKKASFFIGLDSPNLKFKVQTIKTNLIGCSKANIVVKSWIDAFQRFFEIGEDRKEIESFYDNYKGDLEGIFKAVFTNLLLKNSNKEM